MTTNWCPGDNAGSRTAARAQQHGPTRTARRPSCSYTLDQDYHFLDRDLGIPKRLKRLVDPLKTLYAAPPHSTTPYPTPPHPARPNRTHPRPNPHTFEKAAWHIFASLHPDVISRGPGLSEILPLSARTAIQRATGPDKRQRRTAHHEKHNTHKPQNTTKGATKYVMTGNGQSNTYQVLIRTHDGPEDHVSPYDYTLYLVLITDNRFSRIGDRGLTP